MSVNVTNLLQLVGDVYFCIYTSSKMCIRKRGFLFFRAWWLEPLILGYIFPFFYYSLWSLLKYLNLLVISPSMFFCFFTKKKFKRKWKNAKSYADLETIKPLLNKEIPKRFLTKSKEIPFQVFKYKILHSKIYHSLA